MRSISRQERQVVTAILAAVVVLWPSISFLADEPPGDDAPRRYPRKSLLRTTTPPRPKKPNSASSYFRSAPVRRQHHELRDVSSTRQGVQRRPGAGEGTRRQDARLEGLPLDIEPLSGRSFSEIDAIVAFLEALSGEPPEIETPELP